jgi:hypothetical protein
MNNINLVLKNSSECPFRYYDHKNVCFFKCVYPGSTVEDCVEEENAIPFECPLIKNSLSISIDPNEIPSLKKGKIRHKIAEVKNNLRNELQKEKTLKEKIKNLEIYISELTEDLNNIT